MWKRHLSGPLDLLLVLLISSLRYLYNRSNKERYTIDVLRREKEGVLCFTWKVYAVHDGWIADVTANDEEESTTSFSRHNGNGREVVVV